MNDVRTRRFEFLSPGYKWLNITGWEQWNTEVIFIPCTSGNDRRSSPWFLQDEWVVCRLFKKRSEVKKSPTNQSRLGMTAHAMSLRTKGDQLLHHNIGGIGWTYADLVGLTTGLCGGPAMDCLSRSQWSYGGTTAALLPAPNEAQHVPRLPTALPQLHVAGGTQRPAGLTDINVDDGRVRFQQIQQCVDLDGYWMSGWLQTASPSWRYFVYCSCGLLS